MAATTKKGTPPNAAAEKNGETRTGGDVHVHTGFIFRHLLHKEARIGKLATREDPYHIHKTLGILSVTSFIFRYGLIYNHVGSLGFEGNTLDWITMIVHTLLAFSSIIFRVPRKRIDSKPMVIYEEYRQHAMVFTTRCFSVFAVDAIFPSAPLFVMPLVVMAHHLLADRITAIHGSGSTAVRATSRKIKISSFYKRVGYFYSFYQFMAIASHILPNEQRLDMAYNAIVAIQSSAFMMTLYRKRIIRGKTHMLVYSGCLLLSMFHIMRVLGWSTTLTVAVAFAVRINLPRHLSNKYVIWFAFLLWTNRASVVASLGTTNAYSSLDLQGVKGAAAGAMLYLGFQAERNIFRKEDAQKKAT